MATNQQNISIRLAVIDGNRVRQELTQTGEAGERALERIEDAGEPASRSLTALNTVGDQVRGSLEGLAESGGSLVASLASMGPVGLIAAASIGALTLSIQPALQAYAEAEQANLKLSAVLRATGYSAGLTKGDLDELADSIEQTTLRSAEEVKDGASVLLTFKSVQADVFKDTIRLASDAQTIFGGSFSASVTRLGKALEDPIAGVGALKEVGISFTPVQMEMIRNFEEAGDRAEAQKIILKGLEDQVGGTAGAERQGLTGSVKGLNDAWGELLENWGSTISNSPTLQTALSGAEIAIRKLNGVLYPSDDEIKKKAIDGINDYNQALSGQQGTFAKYFVQSVDAFSQFTTGKSLIEEKLQEYKDISNKEYEKVQEQQKADTGKRQSEIDRLKEQITQSTKNSNDRIKELTQTPKQKILEEYNQENERLKSISEKNPDLKEDVQTAQIANEKRKDTELSKIAQNSVKRSQATTKANHQVVDSNQRIIDSLNKRLNAEKEEDPRKRFVMVELDKLNAKASEEYRQKVEQLAGALYDRQEAEKRAKEATEAQKKAIEDLNREFSDLNPSYEQSRQEIEAWKEKMIEALGGVSEVSEETMNKIEVIFTQRMKNAYDQALENSNKWEDGAIRALKKYAEEAGNAAKNAEDAFGRSAENIEDFLVDMVSSGEVSFKKLGDLIMSIQQDLTRSFIRENVTGPLALEGANFFKNGGFKSLFSSSDSSSSEPEELTAGSIYHGGGIVGHTFAPQRSIPTDTFLKAPRFHTGLMPDEMPAILQKGETVLPKGTRIGGNNITFNISTPNAQSFMESQGQIMNRLGAGLSRHRRRNG